MNAPDNPHAKDAEACGAWIRWALRWKNGRHADPDVMWFVARWAGHWGALALARRDR